MTSRCSRVSVAAFGAATYVIVATSAEAFARLDGSPKWTGSTLDMVLELPPPAFVLTDGSVDYAKSFENALQLWNEQLRDFYFTWTERPDGKPNRSNATTEVSMRTSFYNYAFSRDTLAVTFLDYSGGEMRTADVVFNVNQYMFDSYRVDFAGKGEDFHRIALHELGHVLGLDHPDQKGQRVDAIMNAHVSGVDHLLADDIAGGQSIYGAAPNAPSGPTGNGRVANISTRGQVGTDIHVMIGGFIVQNATKPVLIRALGPSLAANGVTGVLRDPVLELHDGNGGVIATNNNWKENPAQAQLIAGTGVAPTDDRESAIYANLIPGSYTGVVSGSNSSTGVALVEVYDLAIGTGRIANISTRAQVGADNDVMIGGFILSGPQAVRVVVRAIGPSLTRAGVADALGDPMLELHNANGDLLKANDNFADNDQPTQFAIEDTGVKPSNQLESAVLAYLTPGNFTAIVRGKNNSSGVGLVEVFDVPVPE